MNFEQELKISYDRLKQENKELKEIIRQHNLCHDLHGTVHVEDFDKGCIAEIRRIYGRAPTKDALDEAIALLKERVHGPEQAWNDWMFKIDEFLRKYDHV